MGGFPPDTDKHTYIFHNLYIVYVVVVVVRWQQGKNGKEVREETEGKSSNWCTGEGEGWKGNIREGSRVLAYILVLFWRTAPSFMHQVLIFNFLENQKILLGLRS